MATRNRRRIGYGGGAAEKVIDSEIIGYNPNPVPEDERDLRRYINDELIRIMDAFDEIYDSEPEQWIAPSLINSWVNYGSPYADAGYYYDRARVYIKGVLKTGTSATIAFTLPEGYRPSEELDFPIFQSGGAAGAFVTIQTDGDVYITGSSVSTFASINNISFRV